LTYYSRQALKASLDAPCIAIARSLANMLSWQRRLSYPTQNVKRKKLTVTTYSSSQITFHKVELYRSIRMGIRLVFVYTGLRTYRTYVLTYCYLNYN